MKKLILVISLLLFSGSYMFSQNFGGVRHLRTQGVVGFQNGVGLDVEYVIPFAAEKLAIRAGYSLMPVNFGSLEIDGLKGELDLESNTIDFGLKYYFSGRSHGMFLGVDVGFDNKNIEFSEVFGKTNSFNSVGGGEIEEEQEIIDGEMELSTTAMMITPKFGWTKVSKNGFTWSFELGYSIINVDPATAIFTDERDGSDVRYEYTSENVYNDLFNMTGLPYVRIGFGYGFKLTKTTY